MPRFPYDDKHSGQPYRITEEKNILTYITKNNLASEVGGNRIWKQMEDANVCPRRTWQSMKNRFKKHIIKRLKRPEYYDLTTQQHKVLRRTWKHTIAGDTTQAMPKYPCFFLRKEQIASQSNSVVAETEKNNDVIDKREKDMEAVPSMTAQKCKSSYTCIKGKSKTVQEVDEINNKEKDVD